MFDTMVFTKALGALCGALLIFLLGSWVSNTLFVSGSRDLPPAFAIDLGNGDADADDGADAPAQMSMAEAFQMADADAGARVWNQCRACHVADDTRNSVGPYLQNVVGRDIEAVADFRYSGALPEGERWTVQNLYEYLENPRGWAPGTSMAFNGLSSQMDRVNVIAYLIDHSPDFDPATDAPAVEEAAAEEATEEDVVEGAREEDAVEEDAAEAPAEEVTEEEAVEAPVEDATEDDAAAVPAGEGREEEVVETPTDEATEARTGEAPQEDVVEAPAEEATEEEVTEAPAEDATEEQAAEAPADEAREEDAAEAPADEAVEEDTAEAPAEEAVEEDVAEAPAEEMSEFAQMVAAGDAQAGSRVWNQCRACHVADAEQNRVGPHLVGVIGRQANSVDGFRYSGNLPDVVWTKDELNAYLENPRGYAPGTSMAFNGLRNVEDRANVLAYIESVQ